MKRFLFIISIILLGHISSAQNSKKYERKAFKKYDKMDYSSALLLYSKAIEMDPNSLVNYVGRGNTKAKLNDFEGAVTDLSKAIDLDVNNIYGTFIMLTRGSYYMSLKDYQNAIKDFDSVIEQDPENSAAYYFRAYSRNEIEKLDLFLGGFESIIADYTKAIELNPNDEQAYFGRGEAKLKSFIYSFYDSIASVSKSIDDFTKAIELDPDYAMAYKERSSAKLWLEDYDGAVADLNKVIELVPDNAEAYLSRGNTKAKLNDFEGAVADLNKAIELDPNYAEAYLYRGEIQSGLEDYDGAVADLNKAIELDPDSYYAYLERGNIRRKLEEYEGAVADYSKAIELDPEYSMGIINSQLEDYKSDMDDSIIDESINLVEQLLMEKLNLSNGNKAIYNYYGNLNYFKSEPNSFNKISSTDINTYELYYDSVGDIRKLIFYNEDGKFKNGILIQENGYFLSIDETESEISTNTDSIYTDVENFPEPPGGMDEYYKFIAETLLYPDEARRLGIEGKVFVQFIIDEKGYVTDVKPIEGIGGGCNLEATRVISLSKKWLPGKIEGKAVKVRMIIPITFTLG